MKMGAGVGKESGEKWEMKTEIVTESRWEIDWKGGARNRRLRESSDGEKQKKGEIEASAAARKEWWC